MLNKSKGNMYPWVTHTWNPIKGKCPHNCSYCYMKRWPQKGVRLVESELRTDLGSGNFIFVGSSCDMWAEVIPFEWLVVIVRNCYAYKNKYLFQSKNPARFANFDYPKDMQVIFGTTIESNRCNCDFTPGAPCTSKRYLDMLKIDLPKMVSIEPVMDFDLLDFVDMIREINPEFVSIGADSRGCHLPEPPAEKVRNLISELQKFTKVKPKTNLNRLLCQEFPK